MGVMAHDLDSMTCIFISLLINSSLVKTFNNVARASYGWEIP
jgi:hypothetical protein